MSATRAILGVALVCCTLPPVSAATPPAIDVAELERCSALVGRDERLDCYDAALAGLKHAPTAATPSTLKAPDAHPVAPAVASVPAAAPTPAMTPTPAASTPAQAATQQPAPSRDAGTFGLQKPPEPVLPTGPDQIKAVVDKLTEDRFGNISIVLDNGQSWVFVETGAYLRPGQTVTIKRAALGSYMAITPDRRSYHIRREQ